MFSEEITPDKYRIVKPRAYIVYKGWEEREDQDLHEISSFNYEFRLIEGLDPEDYSPFRKLVLEAFTESLDAIIETIKKDT